VRSESIGLSATLLARRFARAMEPHPGRTEFDPVDPAFGDGTVAEGSSEYLRTGKQSMSWSYLAPALERMTVCCFRTSRTDVGRHSGL